MELDEPQGELTLHEDVSRPAVFLVGGIGATPARSMILQSTHDATGHTVVLIHSNHSEADAPFFEDFRRAARENPNFTFVPTMTEPQEVGKWWTGETGHIDADMIARHVSDMQSAIYYLSGPATMIEAMQTVLHHSGIDDDSIRTEEFPGY